MGEAIFSKYPKNKGVEISNSTKYKFGLDSSATLDDILTSISYRSESQGTIVAKVEWPDGSPVVNENVRMTSASGENYVYRTNPDGEVVFRTAAGQAWIHDCDEYFDIKGQNIDVACPVGSVNKVTLVREKNLENGKHYLIKQSRWCNFSNLANSAEVNIIGAVGQNGDPSIKTYVGFASSSDSNVKNYPDDVLAAGPMQKYYCVSISLFGCHLAVAHYSNPANWIADINTAHGLFTWASGGSSPNYNSAIMNLSNKNYNLVIAQGYPNEPINYEFLVCNDTYINLIGNKGKTGQTTSAFGLTSIGGAGGNPATTDHFMGYLFHEINYDSGGTYRWNNFMNYWNICNKKVIHTI